jgi:excisionase family DNA binding protein
MTEKYFTVNEVAEKLKYNPQTIRKFIREGRIYAFKVGKNGSYRILETELERLILIGFDKQMEYLKEKFKDEE